MNTAGDLKAAIVAITHRPDYVGARSQFFIDRAQDMVNSECRALAMVATTTLTDSNRSGTTSAVYSLPTDYLDKRAVFGVNGSAQFKVRMVSLAELRYYATSAPPYWGAIYGRKLELRGTPAALSSFDLVYYAKPTALNADADTSTFLTENGDVYLHAALYWAYIEEQALELAQGHADMFRQRVRILNVAAARAQVSGSVSIPLLPISGGY